ncbi:glycosyltransferase family 4 protein [Methylobrevis albus]|nr:glycosyltransferase family 1 protein [Methylobrevis albus]
MTQKTIMIDGYNLNLEKGTGVATYARNLSYECKKLGYKTDILYGTRASPGVNQLMREIAFFDPYAGTPPKWLLYLRHARQIMTSPVGIKAGKIPITGKVITKPFASRMPAYDQIWNAPNLFGRALVQFDLFGRFNKVLGLDTPDIMHWTYPLPLTVKGAKNIYTMHDLVPLRLPYTTLDNKRRYLNLMRRIVKSSDHIVTVSETSRRDIIEMLGCPEEKVTNTYQAVDIPAKYANKPEEVVRREVEGTLGLEYKGYFLFFGSIEPKKNIGRLIEAYLASRIEAPLVIIGAQAWKSEQELRLINDSTNRYLEQIDNFVFTRDRIRRFEYAPFPLLVSAIRGAKAVCFPSLYEGFGLPVLEAMHLGTPVITSTEGSTPEVAGDAALMVDPYDTRALAEAIREMDSNAELRASLSEKGKRQAALFSSERYRERLQALYEKLF